MRNRKKFDDVMWCIGEVNEEGDVVSVVKTFKYEKVAHRWMANLGEGALGPNNLPMQVFVGSQGQSTT